MDMTDQDRAFYQAWAELLEWLREYAAQHEGVEFVKQADFTDYIYRMARPYELPTTIMSASLSNPHDEPILLVTASPRASVFKEVVLHPFESHVYRKLTLAKSGTGLTEGPRLFTKEQLFRLADELFGVAVAS